MHFFVFVGTTWHVVPVAMTVWWICECLTSSRQCLPEGRDNYYVLSHCFTESILWVTWTDAVTKIWYSLCTLWIDRLASEALQTNWHYILIAKYPCQPLSVNSQNSGLTVPNIVILRQANNTLLNFLHYDRSKRHTFLWLHAHLTWYW